MSWMSRMVRRGRRDEDGNPPPPAGEAPVERAPDAKAEARAERREQQKKAKRPRKRDDK